MKRITLDWGYDSLLLYGNSSNPVDVIRDIQKRAVDKYGIEIYIIPYSGIQSSFSGGRPTDQTLEYFTDKINVLNESSKSFNLVINGGLRFGSQINDYDLSTERECMNFLSKNNEIYGVENSITITHNTLFKLAKENYPNLKIISSCIQQLDPENLNDYKELFLKYDYVIPLNQHTSYDILSQFAQFANQMIVFLFLTCSLDNLYRCYLHYQKIETMSSTCSPKEIFTVSSEEFNTIPKNMNITKTSLVGGQLAKRSEDLRKLLDMGVNKFKIQRSRRLFTDDFDKFLSSI